jgi:hypothetical protein
MHRSRSFWVAYADLVTFLLVASFGLLAAEHRRSKELTGALEEAERRLPAEALATDRLFVQKSCARH